MPYVSCTKLDAEIAALEALLDDKQDQLKAPDGSDLAADTCVMSCAQVAAAIADSGRVAAGSNVTVTGAGTAASPWLVSVADASETAKGAVELATTAETIAGTDALKAVTPAGLNAVIGGKQDDLLALDGTALAGGTCVMSCAQVTAAIEAETDKITLVAQGKGYLFTNADGVTTFINPATLVSANAGNGIGIGTDGGLMTTIPAQLPDDQVLSGDNSGNVSLVLTPAVDPVTGNTNYTILANLKTATTNPSGGTNLLVAGASGWFVALKNCAGAYLGADAQVPTCTELTTAITTAVPSTGLTGQVLTKQADGTNAWVTPAAGSSFALVNCAGAAIASGAAVPTCAEFNARIPTGGTTGQVLTKQADGSNAWATSLSLVDCSGAAITSGASVATCANLDARVPTGGTDGQVLTKQADGTNAWETPATTNTATVRVSEKCALTNYGFAFGAAPPSGYAPLTDFANGKYFSSGNFVLQTPSTTLWRLSTGFLGNLNSAAGVVKLDDGTWLWVSNVLLANLPAGRTPVEVITWGCDQFQP